MVHLEMDNTFVITETRTNLTKIPQEVRLYVCHAELQIVRILCVRFN